MLNNGELWGVREINREICKLFKAKDIKKINGMHD